ncbi:DUF2130 domain-containing protein [Hyphomicrobium sp. DY-1]|uniref:DUF2130 domain-containing protein n=1 Tax=Hyphomicrobium sp. DY-1 TaxID=3075650 RepID=UPI0039C00545
MTDLTITCPNCDHEIALTESLAAPLIADTRRQFEAAAAKKDREIAAREAAMEEKAGELEKARASLDAMVAEKLVVERQRIVSEEAQKAKQRAAADLEEKANALAELQNVLKERDQKLAEAQKAQAEFQKKVRELDDAKREMDLNVQKGISAGLESERAKAKLEAEEALKLRVSEKDQIIASMQNKIEELKRKAEQGSQQLQGEVLELELENILKAKFPFDTFEAVPKGEFGADLIQRVVNVSGASCGSIIWEMKRTKDWRPAWIGKLKDDQRRAKADLAIIVSSALPKDIQTFDNVDGIWVTDFRCAVPIALALRQLLSDVATARVVGEGQQSKMALVYDYLTGPRFRHRIEAIVEKFDEMQSDLDKERKAIMKSWAKREAQITAVLDATAGMYGDLQGIAGKALKEIEGFELPMLEDGKGDDESEAA